MQQQRAFVFVMIIITNLSVLIEEKKHENGLESRGFPQCTRDYKNDGRLILLFENKKKTSIAVYFYLYVISHGPRLFNRINGAAYRPLCNDAQHDETRLKLRNIITGLNHALL